MVTGDLCDSVAVATGWIHQALAGADVTTASWCCARHGADCFTTISAIRRTDHHHRTAHHDFSGTGLTGDYPGDLKPYEQACGR